MLTLAITTSTSIVGVALGGALRQVTTDRRHAEELPLLIQQVAEQESVAVSDIERLVVDIGPGRFTGLRVGLAMVKGLALATGADVVGLTSLEILAAGHPGRPVAAVIDARRGEVFQQVFDSEGAVGDAIVGDPAVLGPQLAGIAGIGDGADRYRACYGAEPAAHLDGAVPSAAAMLALADGRQSVSGEQIAPVYLRDPDVTVNIKTRGG